ncbi:MAG: DUF177 domain-containing protein [Bacteroidales bacterium]|jgi:uncharacterized metal-binding protein YceD (DUF177 family)|nr:DUF177 domain-containing protein [Bacteroidales bacterium]
MSVEDTYLLNIRTLPIGESEGEYLITKELFDKFNNTDIISANVDCKVKIDRTDRIISLFFSFRGVISVLCDRCLEPLNLNIMAKDVLYMKLGDENIQENEEDNVVYLHEREMKFDLSQFLYESVLSQKPFRCVHGEVGEGECNAEMIERIEKQNVETSNNYLSDNNNKELDPRWEALKKIDNL